MLMFCHNFQRRQMRSLDKSDLLTWHHAKERKKIWALTNTELTGKNINNKLPWFCGNKIWLVPKSNPGFGKWRSLNDHIIFVNFLTENSVIQHDKVFPAGWALEIIDFCWHRGVFPWKMDVPVSFLPLIMLAHGKRMGNEIRASQSCSVVCSFRELNPFKPNIFASQMQ